MWCGCSPRLGDPPPPPPTIPYWLTFLCILGKRGGCQDWFLQHNQSCSWACQEQYPFLFRPLVPARDRRFLVPFGQCWFLFLSGTLSFIIPASGSWQRLPLPGSVQAMLVPVPVRNSILSYSGLWFLAEIATSWFRSGNTGSCSWQEQYPS